MCCHGAATTNCFPAFDGNGNVMALVNAADGTSLANYAYGPFGELIQQTGIMTRNNPIRFSTKYQDDESISFITAIAITNRHCAGKFQSGTQTRAGVEMQSARIRFNQPRETRFKHHENYKINRRCSVCAANGTNRFCLLLPVKWALAFA